MGLRAVVYYLSTSMCAVVIGVTLVMTIRPGERGDTGLSSDFTVQKKTPLDAILDLMRLVYIAGEESMRCFGSIASFSKVFLVYQEDRMLITKTFC